MNTNTQLKILRDNPLPFLQKSEIILLLYLKVQLFEDMVRIFHRNLSNREKVTVVGREKYMKGGVP